MKRTTLAATPMNFREFEQLSPNFSAEPRHERRGVVCHHSVMSFDETVRWMSSPESQVSYHCLIAGDGARCTLVREEHIAWHAGESAYRGRRRCNDFLLGLAFAGDTYAAPLTSPQIASALEWLGQRWAVHGWTPECVTDHRQISPGRKDDLNPSEWLRLHAQICARFATGAPRLSSAQ